MSRIVRLQASGFKRLVAVDITPDAHFVKVGGLNEEGKTSVLDAMFAAIGGADAAPIKPVRTGEEFAIIRVEIGNDAETVELRATRYFSADGEVDRLKLETADGAAYGAAQTKLDDLVGSITFDPLAFANMGDKEQVAELLRLVPLEVDLAALKAADKVDYAERRDVNRDAGALKARIEAIPVHEDLPEVAPDKDALTAQLAAAAETNTAIERERDRRAAEVRQWTDSEQSERDRALSADQHRRRAEELRAEAARLDEEAERLDAERAQLKADREAALERLAALPPLDEPVDTGKLREQIADAEAVLAKLADRDRRRGLLGEFQTLKAKSDALTAAMAERAAARQAALEGAKMPIDGLSLAVIEDELRVTYNGEPFSQSSGAQRIRVSTALAIAANPKLRVCRIKDGSLLDPKNLAVLAEMAEKHDFQIWIEVVGEEGGGIVMEAGKVKGAPDPKPLDPPKRRKKAEEGGDEAEASPAAEGAPSGGAAAPKADAGEKRQRPGAMSEIVTPPAGKLL